MREKSAMPATAPWSAAPADCQRSRAWATSNRHTLPSGQAAAHREASSHRLAWVAPEG